MNNKRLGNAEVLSFLADVRVCRMPQIASLQPRLLLVVLLPRQHMSAEMNELCKQRNHLRKQFMEGRTLRKIPFADNKWHEENDAKLLGLHYQSDPKGALDDACYMICSEIPRVSIKERKKKASKKRAKLDPSEPEIISEWYDNKNQELESGPDGDRKKKEREEREHRVRQQVEREQQAATVATT